MVADRARMKAIILDLEADGADHGGADIDDHVARALGLGDVERHAKHPGGHGVFANAVDWAKANLTEQGLHAVVGKAGAHNVYRITPAGREAAGTARAAIDPGDQAPKPRDLMAPDTEPTDEELGVVMREARDHAVARKS